MWAHWEIIMKATWTSRSRLLPAIGPLLGLVVVSVQAETRDGYWWARQSETVKLAYVLGSIDRTMLTGSVDPKINHDIVDTPHIKQIVARIDSLYATCRDLPFAPDIDCKAVLVQKMLAVALIAIDGDEGPRSELNRDTKLFGLCNSRSRNYHFVAGPHCEHGSQYHVSGCDAFLISTVFKSR